MNRTSRLSWLALGLVASVVSPALADDYLVFTDGGIPAGGSDVWVWCENQATIPCDFAELRACDTPEGSRHFRQQGTVDWQGFGVFHNIDPGPDGVPATGDEFATPVDLSAFLGGEMRFFVKSSFELQVQFQCQVSGTNKTGTASLAQGGWDPGNPSWQEIVIPLSSFTFGAGPPVNLATCLGAVLSPFMSTGAGLGAGFHTFRVDNVRWRKANSHPGPSTVQVSGRQLLVNGQPFVVNGLSYGPISIGEDWRGALRDRPDRYLVDFPLIAATGANTVRIYTSFLTTAMLDAAWANGLFVIPTFPVDPLQVTCPTGRDFITDRFRDMVNQWKNHPAILFWLVGNEVNVNLGTANLCGDWYPALDAMAQAAHVAEGPSFHPVGTANADTGFSDICQPGCSDDTTLPNVDLWGVQIYRGCSFGTAFAEYAAKADCSRPLVVTEFGADSWDSLSGPSGAENQAMQATCLATLLGEADQALAVRTPGGVSSGQVVFEWADEWWKAFPTPGGDCDTTVSWAQHDTCKNWESLAYPDPAMNEEWWGITGLDAANPNVRAPRAAQTTVGNAWHLGNVCNMDVVSFDPVSGNTSLSFDPAPGSTDHTLYLGPLSDVSTYNYSGSLSGLGATGTASLTLPAGDLFWLVVGRDGTREGGYGTGVAERPASSGASVPQDPNRTGLCSSP